MFTSKVIDILKTFSPDEMKKFGEFLNSPFHNKNKKAIVLYDLLLLYHPDYENKNLTKENLFDKIFSDNDIKKVYNDASMRNLLSDLIMLAENFLSYSGFSKDKFYFNERILRELSERKLTGLFEKKLKYVENFFSKKEFESEEEFYKKFIIEELKSSSSQFSDDLSLYKTDFNVKASEYLTYFYLVKIFKIINFFEFQKQYNIEHQVTVAENLISGINLTDLLNSVRKSSADDYLLMQVYYSLYCALSDPDSEEKYFEFKRILLENENRFAGLEKYALYVCLTNSCVQKIDKGNEKFFKECFEIYKRMYEKNLFDAYPGYFSMTTFTAIITTGIAAKEFNEVEMFINTFSDKLNPRHKSDAVNYSLAQLHFSKKEFGKALEFISKTDTGFSNFKFLLKIISLKIYYELGDYDSLYFTADSFNHFLGKNKVVGKNYKSEFNSFIKILDWLVKYKLGKDEKYFYKISRELEQKNIASKKWLKEKFRELVK